eukprot:CAMPEP_0115131942 /NCGR_PEP_ID=MMETSP0227-20121206/53434_1 /TAXON_ID=89957 /ORGANISM="Polarella glacialis, Strain CCMP 1383" /LENGTH=33 /DNA_ID= /DNA_START= /DNA_END= /DNA_ORIENTATION=
MRCQADQRTAVTWTARGQANGSVEKANKPSLEG